jgi:serralysin
VNCERLVRGTSLKGAEENLSGTANDKTIVEGDINGDRVADFQIELSGLKVLVASDFLL